MNNKLDSQNMYESILNFPENIKDALKIVSNFSIKNRYKEIKNIVISGMGGSAIGADIVFAIGRDKIKIPFTVSRGYKLPNWVDKNTLVICSSYSGNTEETLASFDDAMKKKAQICGVTTGGVLKEKLTIHRKDKIIIPSGLQPRAALAFSFIPISKYLEELDILKFNFDLWISDFLNNIIGFQNNYKLKSDKNPVYCLAKNIFNKIPIIYADNSTLSIVSKRIKDQISENSKMLVYQNDLPELNHNEIVGWENNLKILKNFVIIWLKDERDYVRIKYRQKVSKNILEEIGIEQFSIQVEGVTFEERFLHMIHFGDWLSYWCAILHNTDPTPVEKIERLKISLNNFHNKKN